MVLKGPAAPAAPIVIFANGVAGNGLVLDTGSDGSTIENLTIAGFIQGIGNGFGGDRSWHLYQDK